MYVCSYNKHSFLIYSVYLERLPRSDSDIPVQRGFLLWYRTKECWAYALSSKRKESYLFVQLQEGWFSCANTCLILSVTQPTNLLFPWLTKKVLLRGDEGFQHMVPVLLPSTCCCTVNITAFLYRMLLAICREVNALRRDWLNQSKAFCSLAWSWDSCALCSRLWLQRTAVASMTAFAFGQGLASSKAAGLAVALGNEMEMPCLECLHSQIGLNLSEWLWRELRESCHLPSCQCWSCASSFWSLFGGPDLNLIFCPGWILNFYLWNLFFPLKFVLDWFLVFSERWGFNMSLKMCLRRDFAGWYIELLDAESSCATPFFQGRLRVIQFSQLLWLMEGRKPHYWEHSGWYRRCLKSAFIEKAADRVGDVTSTVEWQRHYIDWKAAQDLTRQWHLTKFS